MKDKNSLQATLAAFHAYATPINISGGILGNYADHTFVYATGAGGATYNCTCYGDTIVPAQVDIPIVTIQGGDMRTVSCMINLSPVLKPIYNGWLDNCGIIYGLQGVCHQMTNRILMTAGHQTMPLSQVRGYIPSFILYGFFGHTTLPFIVQLLLAQGISALSGLGREQISGDMIPEFDFERWTALFDKIETYISNTNDKLLKLLLQMEVYGVNNPQNRLSALYLHFILEGDSSKLHTDKNLQELNKQLEQFLLYKERIYKDETEKDRIKSLNREFVNLNKSMVNILGSENYKKLFQFSYKNDFYLYEYPDMK